jgi:hypothetical protein
VRVRIVLCLALLIVAGAFALEMSRRAPRTAGSDHTASPVFSATVPEGGVLCQREVSLPPDAGKAQILIGTYGHPAPALRFSFIAATGIRVAEGRLPAGARGGRVAIPLERLSRAPGVSACLRVGRPYGIALGGEQGPVNPSSETVNGQPQPGRISLLYYRSGAESWWQLLPVLSERFGLGKASFFGDWTLALAAILLVAVWVGTVRLLLRELT